MELSPTMLAAYDLAAKHDNGLVRFPGGYWAQEGWDSHSKWFSTPTIQALVSRGVATYSRWYEGRSRFPIEITLSIAVLHCSCGAALTREEYQEHQKRGHDSAITTNKGTP